MKTAFISYRRADSAGYTGRLYGDLSRAFSDNQIFMDVDDIPPGSDFVLEINKRLQYSKVLIVLIGSKWLKVENEHGIRRLDDPKDFVRLEIEQAIKNKIKILPVLIENTEMPNEDDLPESIKPLSRVNGLSLRNADYSYHVYKIISFLSKEIGKPKNNHVIFPTALENKSSFAQKVVRFSIWLAIIGAVLAGLLLLREEIARGIKQSSPDSNYPSAVQSQQFSEALEQASQAVLNEVATNHYDGTWNDGIGRKYNFTPLLGDAVSIVLTGVSGEESVEIGAVNGNTIQLNGMIFALEQDLQHIQVTGQINNQPFQFRLHKNHLPQ